MITAPYNFVPLSGWIFSPDWAERVSHDMPFRDGISGRIDIKITAETPILIGNAHKDNPNGLNEVHFCTINRRYAIPGTTLKGMIRNVLEIASFGKMSYVDDRRLGIRDISGKRVREKNYLIEGQKAGFLRLRQGSHGEAEIVPCQFVHIEHPEMSREEAALTDEPYLFKAGMSVAQKYQDYDYSIGGTIAHTHPDHLNDDIPDLAEVMLGKVHPDPQKNHLNLKSRVSFGACFVEQDNTQPSQNGYTTVLSGPKPTYFPNYVRQDKTPELDKNKEDVAYHYRTYMQYDSEIRGWKRYPVRQNKEVNISPPPRQFGRTEREINLSVQSKLFPLPAQTTFSGSIRFHNLKPEELGALLWVLEWGGDSRLRHNIGMGKPLGFGVIKLEVGGGELRFNRDFGKPVSLTFEQRKAYYQQFEHLMDEQYQEAQQQPHVPRIHWKKSEQLILLIAMAWPEHGKAKSTSLRYMLMGNINEFNQAKQNGWVLPEYQTLADDQSDRRLFPRHNQPPPTQVTEDTHTSVTGQSPVEAWLEEQIGKAPKKEEESRYEWENKLTGKLLAKQWQELEEGKFKQQLLDYIEEQWRGCGDSDIDWWERPITNSMRQAKKIYTQKKKLIEIEGNDKNFLNDSKIPIFDPKKIDITTEQHSLSTIIAMIKAGQIDLNPEFQRKGNLWSEPVMSRLIESIFLLFPIPAFYFDAELPNDEKWLVVDGLQRLCTLKRFMIEDEEQPLVLKSLNLLTDWNGKTFQELDKNAQKRIERYRITTYLIKPNTPKIARYEIFRRLNTGGLTLTEQETRHALNSGKSAQYLEELSENKCFTQIISVDDSRMADRELILRYLAFSNKSYTEYQPPMAQFLDEAMENLGTLSDAQLEQLKENLWKALEICQYLFEEHIFSRSILGNGRYRLNAALFEVWTVLIGALSNSEINQLKQNKHKLIEAFQSCLRRYEFYRAIYEGTASQAAVITRFKTIQSLIDKYTV